MRPWSHTYAGRLEARELTSEALRDNPLGDSATRPLYVYVPPGYDDDPGQRYPAVYVLQGYLGALPSWNYPANTFRATYPEMADELFSSGGAPPCLVVFVDAWTSLGGSQFVDSPGTGRYHTYLCEDVVGFVDATYRTLDRPAHRAVQGKSSGGFGAMVTAMLRPDLFGGFASHAGDAGFEHCFLPEIAAAYRALRDRYDRSYEAFFEDFRSRPALSKGPDFALLMVYAMAACFSSDADGTVHLPFDVATGRLDEAAWARWLAWDPVRMAALRPDSLRSLRAIWVDAGRSDDAQLDLGAEAFVDELRRLGVDEVRFELFDGTHRGIEHRYPLALAYLAERISPSAQ